jgi:hypothetical protein
VAGMRAKAGGPEHGLQALSRLVISSISSGGAGPVTGPRRGSWISASVPREAQTRVLRDEDTAYATRVWAGGFHGFAALYPQARISTTARRNRTDRLAPLMRDAIGRN